LWLEPQDRIINSDRNITVTILGTGTPFVDSERFGAAVLVDAGGKKLLFDCGRGAVIRLKQAGISPEQIDGLFLTHLHSDHVVASRIFGSAAGLAVARRR
jgi:ribonuclease Z